MSALAEKLDTFFRSFVVVALAEALAIYGLTMGILLWLKLQKTAGIGSLKAKNAPRLVALRVFATFPKLIDVMCHMNS